MALFNFPTFIKFLGGIFLLQGAMTLLIITALQADWQQNGWLFGMLGLLFGVIAALWFTTITSHISQQSYVRASEKFNRQRDRLRVQASKEKTQEIRSGHQQVLRETRRVQTRSALKLGIAMTGVAGLGVLLLFTQFMTLGLLAVSAAGGAMLGYGVRARQYPVLRSSQNGAQGILEAKPIEESSDIEKT